METTKRAYKSRIKTNKRTGKSNLKKVNLLKKKDRHSSLCVG